MKVSVLFVYVSSQHILHAFREHRKRSFVTKIIECARRVFFLFFCVVAHFIKKPSRPDSLSSSSLCSKFN